MSTHLSNREVTGPDREARRAAFVDFLGANPGLDPESQETIDAYLVSIAGLAELRTELISDLLESIERMRFPGYSSIAQTIRDEAAPRIWRCVDRFLIGYVDNLDAYVRKALRRVVVDILKAQESFPVLSNEAGEDLIHYGEYGSQEVVDANDLLRRSCDDDIDLSILQLKAAGHTDQYVKSELKLSDTNYRKRLAKLWGKAAPLDAEKAVSFEAVFFDDLRRNCGPEISYARIAKALGKHPEEVNRELTLAEVLPKESVDRICQRHLAQ